MDDVFRKKTHTKCVWGSLAKLGALTLVVRQMIMSQRAKIVALFVCAAGAVLAAIALVPKHYAHEQYVCTLCGVRQVVDNGRLGPFPYRHKMTIIATAVSTSLKLKDCQHDWMLYRFGRGTGSVLFGWREHADGGSRSTMIPTLLLDERFAADLATVEGSSEVWKALIRMIDTDPSMDQSLAQWWQQGPDRPSFRQWWSGRNEQPR